MFGFLRLFSRKKEEKRGREIRVSIQELSQLWLPYNKSFVLPEEGSRSEKKELKSGVESVQAFFSQSIIQEFYEPYRLYFENQGAKDGFIALLHFLDNVKNEPSVRGVKEGGGGDQFFAFGELLSKVSLGEHSVDVARAMLDLLEESYRDYKNLIPKALIASFGHDIGKASVVIESGAYGKGDHPILSAQKVAEIFAGREPKWLNEVLNAIRMHHFPKITDQFASLLKKADLQARAMEAAARSKEFKIRQWDEWFDSKEFLEILLPEINVLQPGNKWKALSFGSVVYFQPDFLYESLRAFAKGKGVIEPMLLRVLEKQDALKKLVESLRNGGLISDEVREPYWGRHFFIRTPNNQKRLFLVPIRIDAFELLPHMIEKRKEGYLREIDGVIPD
jgi:hypothetical protein